MQILYSKRRKSQEEVIRKQKEKVRVYGGVFDWKRERARWENMRI